MTLIRFGMDGTMEFGSPPGHITLNHVRKAKELGYIVVSASDRPISNQEELWKLHDIQVDFVALKHKLPELKERFEPDECLHVGDTEMDRFFAAQAGFDFLLIHEVPEDGSHLWMLQEESTDDADFAERRGVESQSVSSAQSVE